MSAGEEIYEVARRANGMGLDGIDGGYRASVSINILREKWKKEDSSPSLSNIFFLKMVRWLAIIKTLIDERETQFLFASIKIPILKCLLEISCSRFQYLLLVKKGPLFDEWTASLMNIGKINTEILTISKDKKENLK